MLSQINISILMNCLASPATNPIKIPYAMHGATQRLHYFSKKAIFFYSVI